jgi:hypothetical protein
MKKTLCIVGLSIFATATVFAAPFLKSQPAQTTVKGEYVEARTASVFAGACHYNGELMTTGRDAVMAWSFTGGSFNGVDLAGVRVMAAVSCVDSLQYPEAARKSELTIDSRATDAQATAVKALLESKVGAQLGEVVAIHRAPVSFQHGSDGYTVAADKLGSMRVQYMTDNACCTSPSLVWYFPLTPLENRKVGFTESASYNGAITEPWQRFGENGAFYGTFTF